MRDCLLYIDAEFRDSSRRVDIINPATSEPIARAALATAAEASAAIEAARFAFDRGPWPRISLKERSEILRRVAQGILDNAEELARLETLNVGKPIKETTFMDIPSSARTFEYCAENLERFFTPETINIPGAATGTLVREPLGVAVLIVPWNYPLLIASWKMASALAAGNTVVLKPSSLTPLSSLELARIIHEAGAPPGVVNVIPAAGEEIGQALCADPRVDMISFTGSNDAGRQILNYSSRHVKKLVMELGGKSAGLVFKDADLELAVNGSLCSIYLNQGQMCTAMSRIFVEEEVFEKFCADFVSKAERITLGNGLDYLTQMGPLISDPQRRRVMAAVEGAVKEGATLLTGGTIPQDPSLKNGFFFRPTCLTGTSAQMDIFRQEVFGPVVCIERFRDTDEAVVLANSTDFGLACSIWTSDAQVAGKATRQINAGIIWINTYGMFYNEVPFGGFKQSGFGKELGREGFFEYTRLKNVVTDTSREAKPLVNYWYGF